MPEIQRFPHRGLTKFLNRLRLSSSAGEQIAKMMSPPSEFALPRRNRFGNFDRPFGMFDREVELTQLVQHRLKFHSWPARL